MCRVAAGGEVLCAMGGGSAGDRWKGRRLMCDGCVASCVCAVGLFAIVEVSWLGGQASVCRSRCLGCVVVACCDVGCASGCFDCVAIMQGRVC